MPLPSLTRTELRSVVRNLPRVDLAHLPTPLEEIPRFSDEIHGPRLFIKRDDCTGLLFGGNKTRHNEFLLADALQRGAEQVIWGAGVQSNNCRQTAAACARLGLECFLYLSKGGKTPAIQGNLLLDYLVGARVELVDAELGPELDRLLAEKAEAFRKAGRRPYVWDRKHCNALASISYALCLAEIVEQLEAIELKPSSIYVSSAGATGAGLLLGKALLGLPCAIRLQAPIKWPWNMREGLADITNNGAALLGLPHRITADDVELNEESLGPGYGKNSPEGAEALRLLAVTEGILLDPVYTAKAMAGLIADIHHQRVQPDEVVVFLHTGGTPAVFAYADEVLAEYLYKGGH
jgi:1-aminocyclopropane-1-carboxylate deaminase/D-cysteine desulfhydrase-like pyridoxal-dependent ACC family enzyme